MACNRIQITRIAVFCSLLVVGLETTSASLSIPSSKIVPSDVAPKWLSHIDQEMLNKYVNIAQQRHDDAIKNALKNYDITKELDLTEDELAKEKTHIDKMKFNEYHIDAHGKIPDFQKDLGERSIFVTHQDTPLLTAEECQEAIDIAEKYYEGKKWPKVPSGQYLIQGFFIKDVPPVRDWFIQKVKTRLFPLAQKLFPQFVDSIESLVVDAAYLFKYVPEPGIRTEIHTDSGCLSFTIALNPRSEYEGGGTWMEGVGTKNNVIEMDQGHVTIRPGGVRHSGNPLKSGTRFIIGGFCMNKDKTEHVRQLMNNCEQRDDPKTRLEALECAIALNPYFDGPYPNVAHMYENRGDKDLAQLVLQDCLKLANPLCSPASYYLGTMYYKEKNYDKAMECMKICLSVDSSDGDALQTLGQIFARKGDVENERKTYESAISAPGVSERVLTNVYCNLGVLNEGTDKEIEYYRKSLELTPDHIPALHSIGCAYASMKKWDESIKAFRHVMDMSKNNSDSYENQLETLKFMHKAVILKIREEGVASSREEMMEQLKEHMGAENLDLLIQMQSSR